MAKRTFGERGQTFGALLLSEWWVSSKYIVLLVVTLAFAALIHFNTSQFLTNMAIIHYCADDEIERNMGHIKFGESRLFSESFWQMQNRYCYHSFRVPRGPLLVLPMVDNRDNGLGVIPILYDGSFGEINGVAIQSQVLPDIIPVSGWLRLKENLAIKVTAIRTKINMVKRKWAIVSGA
ncbi:hypothetical protein HYPSUDRAFT_209363 [Hypholoma sublateritium FD-334 SS-4]|uniref:Uncharacterized protein n=1 Tax=Hypholoma sublateritium (strain FD-334 SS-4) TaxID=945553 RepID=A0A0D2LS99_HYPSF|nr:hypothetical protein HYPSUDRAFT_209363 [Hypholoma sublateritium FD-334 SS-4]